MPNRLISHLSCLVLFVATCPVSPAFAEGTRALEFLKSHCVRCHGPQKQHGEVVLHELTEVNSENLEVWTRVVERLQLGDMPPEGQPRPEPAAVQEVLRDIRNRFVAFEADGDLAKLILPEYGNYVDHRLLFSGEIKTPPFSPARLWRLSPEIFAARNPLEKQTPFGYSTEENGLRDYSATSVVDQGTVEMLINIVSKQFDRDFERFVVATGSPRHAYDPFGKPEVPSQVEIERVVSTEFEKAVGRTPSQAERDKYAALLKKNVQVGGGRDGLKTTLLAIHLSPEAIYRMELGLSEPDEHGRRRLSETELAFAIAYALTNQSPYKSKDIQAALASEQLKTREGVAELVRTMLYDVEPLDPQANPRLIRFFREFFGYDQVLFVFKDDARQSAELGFPISTPGIRMMVEDLENWLRWIVDQDQDVFETILSTDQFLVGHDGDNQANRQRLADYLDPANRSKNENVRRSQDQRLKFALDRGVDPFPGNTALLNYVRAWGFPYEGKAGQLWDWPVEQPFKIEHRRGILTHPAWLWSFSTNFDNDPIHRGKWIREKLLAGVLPDVPPDVDAQVPEDPHKTLRQRLDVVRSERCWSCHKKMNPLGEPFEIFDDFGRYRPEVYFDTDAELVVRRDETFQKQLEIGELTSQDVDGTGEISGTGEPNVDGPVSNALELMDRLSSSERVRQSIVRHAFRYFMGRNELLSDSQTLIEADRAYVESGGSYRALVISLLSSDSFLYRR